MFLFVGQESFRKRDNKPFLKFYMKKSVIHIYRMASRVFDFGGLIADFGAIEISRCFGA
jgi:hypothetical protein